MPALLVGLLVLITVLYGLRLFAQSNPAKIARGVRKTGGFAAIVGAVTLLARGSIGPGLALGAFGAWLLGIGKNFSFGGGFSGGPFQNAGTGAGKGGGSRVRSAMIEMELDLDTGAMNGTILAGPDEGKTLDSLTRPQCGALFDLCLRDDPEGARLLEAYLDRRFAGWRAARERDTHAGGCEGRSRSGGAMSEDEAYEILGLQKGATRDDVVRSHRTLMKKLHPDHGGSTDLAARVNEAKDVLMRRHF